MSRASEFHHSLKAANGGAWFDFEGLVRDIYAAILKPGDVALDVGVNRGDHLLQMAGYVGGTGLVVGIEAAPKMVELTNTFLVNSGLAQLKNVVMHNVAVADKEGTATFHYVATQPGLSSLAERDVAGDYEVETFECRVTTIDTLLQDMTRKFDFAKFDIEGAEFHAFKGASRLFTQDRCPMVFEYDRTSPTYFKYTPEEFARFFYDQGYKVQDFFGFSYETAEDFAESEVWNYFAAPADKADLYPVRDVVMKSLRDQGIALPDRLGR
jgi:FkbM family methyltransferase